MNAEEHLADLVKDRDNVFFRCVEDCYEPIMITDTGGKLIYTNEAWCRVYGYSKEEAIGETPRILRSSHQTDEFYSKLWDQILDPNIGTWRGELINLSKSGEEVPVLLNITPYKSPDGSTLGYMGLALDLTQKKAMEKQMAQQDRLATIGELTSGLAHEIGTPIGVIRGRAEMLQMQMEDNAPAQKGLGTIIKQIDRISSLISSLLRLSRNEQDEKDLKEVNLASVVTDVEELLAQKLRKANIRFTSSVNEDIAVIGDHNKLEQILINILINAIYAIKAMTAKQHHADKAIEVTAIQVQSQIKLTIVDTGGGIPKSILNKIFNPFFTTKPTSDGTGLGLAIVARIVHELGGTIDVKSTEGVGTKFIVTLQKA